MLSWVFLALSLLGVALTLNAYRPPRAEVISIVTFFCGWLVSELPIHTVVIEAAATVAFVASGALHHPAGWVGLGLAIVSWAALVRLAIKAQQAGAVTEAALDAGLGPAWRELRDQRLSSAGAAVVDRAQLVVPFWMRDSRVERRRNIDYWGDGTRAHRLDVYRPRHPSGPAPVLIYIHGGGWVLGDKREQGLPMMLYLASQGWVCVTINYRLSPKATWPDHLVDCKRALAWVHEHIAEYGGDSSFVAVSGGSAGGHLAALVGLTAGEARYQPGFETGVTRVDACVPFYGVYDFTNRDGLWGKGFGAFLERSVMKAKRAEHPELFRDASPMDQVHDGVPPFMVTHGGNDTLVPVQEARRFSALLRESSAGPVVYAELPGAQHAFEVFRSVRTAHAVAAVTDFLAFVRAAAARSGQAEEAAGAN